METIVAEKIFASAKDLVLGFPGCAPLHDEPFSFQFPKGAIIALIGGNGAGKTTLLRALLGEKCHQHGELRYRGTLVSPGHCPEGVAFLPQEHHYPPELTVVDSLRLAFLPRVGFFGALPPPHAPELQDALAHFGLASHGNRSLKTLSTGERQRAFLARAFLQKPHALLLDEPTNHLDPAAVVAFGNALQEGKAAASIDVLVSTHDLWFAKNYCDWIAAMKAGRLVYVGPAEAFWNEKKASAIFGADLRLPF